MGALAHGRSEKYRRSCALRCSRKSGQRPGKTISSSLRGALGGRGGAEHGPAASKPGHMASKASVLWPQEARALWRATRASKHAPRLRRPPCCGHERAETAPWWLVGPHALSDWAMLWASSGAWGAGQAATVGRRQRIPASGQHRSVHHGVETQGVGVRLQPEASGQSWGQLREFEPRNDNVANARDLVVRQRAGLLLTRNRKNDRPSFAPSMRSRQRGAASPRQPSIEPRREHLRPSAPRCDRGPSARAMSARCALMTRRRAPRTRTSPPSWTARSSAPTTFPRIIGM